MCGCCRLRDTVLASGGPDRYLGAKYSTQANVIDINAEDVIIE